MAYLGIDPSLRSTGVCLIDNAGKSPRRWQIKTNHKTLPESLVYIWDQLSLIADVIGHEELHGAAVETPFVGNNKLTTMKLSAVWGVVLCMVMRWHPVTLFEIHPTALKRFVTGYANADKEQMLLQTHKIWGFDDPCDDIVDAFGLAHLARCGDAPKAYSLGQQDVLRQYLRLKNAAGAEVE